MRLLRGVIAVSFVATLSYLGWWLGAYLPNPDGDAIIAVIVFVGPQLLFLVTLLAARMLPIRPRPGHCHRCDYNLTGNTAGRCPECGTKVR